MADTKISALTELTQPVSGDFLPIVDTSAAATKKLDWGAIAQGGVNVDAHGATGDGSTNDNDGIEAAITSAGTNGVVRFTPGKTYVIDNVISPLTGQTWIGYGATLKRADRVATTFTAGAANGATTLTVADASGFRVGSQIVGWENGDETLHMTVPVTVVTASGTTITCSPGISYAAGFSSTDNLETGFELVSSTADDFKIYGLTFDGNGTSYSSGLHAWEVHTDLVVSGDRTIIKDCVFDDAQCEGLIIGGAGSKAVNNSFLSNGGNPIHLSGLVGGLIDGNYIFDSQVYNADANNHQDGAISISTGIIDNVISNNYYDGNSNGLAFLGGFSLTTESMTVTGNHAKDATKAIQGSSSYTGISANHVVSNNTFENCGLFDFNDTSGNKRIENLSISNNVLIETKISIDNVDGCTISGNTVVMETATGTGFQVLDSFNVNISSNTYKTAGNGLLAISIDSGGAGLTKNVKVDGNVFTGHAGTSNLISVLALGNEASGVVISNNRIEGGTTAANNITCIYNRADGTEISNNNVDWSGITAGSNILLSWDGTNATAGTIRNNYLKHALNERAIVCTAGANDMSIIGNHLSGDVDPRGDDQFIQGNLIESGSLFITGDGNSIVGNRVKGASEVINCLASSSNNFLDGNITTAEIVDAGTNNNNTAGTLAINTTLGAALDNYHGI